MGAIETLHTCRHRRTLFWPRSHCRPWSARVCRCLVFTLLRHFIARTQAFIYDAFKYTNTKVQAIKWKADVMFGWLFSALVHGPSYCNIAASIVRRKSSLSQADITVKLTSSSRKVFQLAAQRRWSLGGKRP